LAQLPSLCRPDLYITKYIYRSLPLPNLPPSANFNSQTNRRKQGERKRDKWKAKLITVLNLRIIISIKVSSSLAHRSFSCPSLLSPFPSPLWRFEQTNKFIVFLQRERERGGSNVGGNG